MLKFKHRLTCSLLTTLVLQGCSQSEKIDQRTLPDQLLPGSFVVEIDKQSESQVQADQYLQELGQELGQSHGCDAAVEQMKWEQSSGVISAGLLNTYHLEMSNCDLDQDQVDQILIGLLDEDKVLSAEATSIVSTNLVENDRRKGSQYYLDNVRRNQACDAAPGTGKPVVVAVVDTGVQSNHPDLVDRFYRDANGSIIGANFVGKGSRRSADQNWDDRNGHGTHVAGLIGASANNGIGIAGVAACKNVLIMPIKVLGDSGSGNSIEIDRGVQWAAANGADIINLSLGSTSSSRTKRTNHRKSLYENLNEQGVVVFAAAGNDGYRNGSKRNGRYIYSYPASYDKVISVGATDRGNRLTNFSVYGERVDIAAPGQATLSTYPGSSYRSLSGTSMATPIAIGTYALGLSAARVNGNERLFHDELVELLNQSANVQVRFSKSDILAGGLVDASEIYAKLKDKFVADEQPQPTNPIEPTPEQPQPEPQPENPDQPGPAEFGFVGLTDGQSLDSAIAIKIAAWPERTSRINLYWITGKERFPRAFTSLGRKNLVDGGDAVTTQGTYLFIGSKYLVAEAVDIRGRRLKVSSIKLNGF